MYAQCPHCQTVFAVTDLQLSQAAGKVRCGQCMQPFDALSHQAEMAADDMVSENEPVLGTGPDASVLEPEIEALKTQQSVQPGAEGPLAEELFAEHEPFVIPESLIPDVHRGVRRRTRPGIRMLQWALVLVLIAGLGFQLLWFYPQEVMQRLPQISEWVQPYLVRYQRLPPAARDVSKIRLISREVSAHPKFEGALVVRAMMLNEAGFRQPFPHVRLTLFDVNGAIIARRTFSPTEYLPANERGKNMPVQQGMHFSVELASPETDAVSYEFEFI